MKNHNRIRFMTAGFLRSKLRETKQILFSPLYRNAFYLVLDSTLTGILGFVFWNVMTHHFSVSVVGIGTSLFAAAGLISILAHLGLNVSIIRFVPEVGMRARQLIYEIFLIAAIATAIFASIYLAGLQLWSPAIGFLTNHIFTGSLFVVLTAIMTVSFLLDSAFIARRSAGYVLLKNLITSGMKIILPLLVFFAFGGWGIFLGGGVAVVVSTGVAFLWFLPKVYPKPPKSNRVDLSELKQMGAFSAGNYLVTLFTNAVGYVFPLMVLRILGPADSAFFSMAWLITATLSVIPSAVTSSLLAEGSHSPKDFSRHVYRAFYFAVILLVLAVGLVYALTHVLLGFFGHEYVTHSTTLVYWMLPANFALVIQSLFITMNQIQKKVGVIIIQAFVTSTLTVVLGYYFLNRSAGLEGLGMAYTIANTVIAILLVFPLWKMMRVPIDV